MKQLKVLGAMAWVPPIPLQPNFQWELGWFSQRPVHAITGICSYLVRLKDDSAAVAKYTRRS